MKGLKTISSDFSVEETIEKLISIVQSNGLTIFTRIDHSGNARDLGLELRPIQLILFGNPKAGTVLMQDSQTAGLEVPMRALAWEDEGGKVCLSYTDPAWCAERHGLTEKSAPVIKAIEQGMSYVGNAATQKT